MIKRGELRAFRLRCNIIRIDPLDLRRFLRDREIANEAHYVSGKRGVRLVGTTQSPSE